MVSPSNASTELYNLRWNSYFSNLSNVFVDHQNQETLVDVTLSCEGQFIKAHKLILSACSTYFQKVFEIHSSPEILVILNDVKFKDLQLVVQFMYKGEVKVADSDMQQFLALGKTLQVKGLCSVDLQDKQKPVNGEEKMSKDKSAQISLSNEEDNNKVEQSSPEANGSELLPTPKKRKLPSPVTGDLTSNKKKIVKPSPSNDNQDVSHIPRPPNAFMIFANQWRKKLAVEYPNESNKDISVRLGNMWKSLSQETKDAFYEDARKADEDHKIKYPGAYRYYYSPKEARNRKAIANITKAASKLDSSESNDDDLIEIKFEEKDSEGCESNDRDPLSNSN